MQMARKFESIPADTFSQITTGAGVILTEFTPSSPGTLNRAKILCATDGGVSVTVTPEFVDMADGIDNCPSNTMELKRLKQYTVTISGTGKTASAAMAKKLLGTATATSASSLTTIKPGATLATTDFADLWYVCDYGDTDGNFLCAHIINALSTGGFTMQTADGDKASFSFTFTGHYSIDNMNTAPIEFYIYNPEDTPDPGPTG